MSVIRTNVPNCSKLKIILTEPCYPDRATAEMETELLVEGCAKCINTINPDAAVRLGLHPSRSTRIGYPSR